MKCEDGKQREFELTMTQVMQPYQANLSGNVHGGEVMKFMDNVAGGTAVQFLKTNVVSARVDELLFMKPVHVGSFVTCTGKVVYTGHTSLEVLVTVDVERLISEKPKVRALTAFFTMVAVDKDGRPIPVPGIIPETDDEKKVVEQVEKKRELFKKRRQNKE